MDLFNQKPAITRTAAEGELADLAFEINAAHEAGEQQARKGLERFRVAGEALLKAKEKCGEGKWVAWLEKNVHFDRHTASNYMRVATAWETGVSQASSLRDALRILTEDPDAKPKKKKAKPALATPLKRCRNCRIYGAKEGCKECKKLNQPPEREPGDDTEAEQQAVERENPYAKKLDRYAENLAKIVEACFLRDIRPEDGEKVKADLEAVLEYLRRLALAPIKPGVARPAKCRDCAKAVLWVKTAKGKNMPLDAEPGYGSFEIVKGMARSVPKGERQGRQLHTNHLQTCTQRSKR